MLKFIEDYWGAFMGPLAVLLMMIGAMVAQSDLMERDINAKTQRLPEAIKWDPARMCPEDVGQEP